MEHIYKPTVVARILALLGIPLLIGFGIVTGMQKGNHPQNLSALLIIIPVFAVIAVAALNIATEVVRLTDDRIERKTAFRSQRIPIGEIGGWKVRWHSSRGGNYYSLQILPKDTKLYKIIEISKNVRIDQYFKDWVMKFPNMTGHGGLVGNRMDTPKSQKRFDMNDPNVQVQVKKFSGFGFGGMDITPERMVENYFAQWGL